MSLLQLEDISCGSNRSPVISGLSLNLSAGEIGCLLGPSGCGKTTLLRTIAGFCLPIAGSIYLNGEQISHASAALPPEKRNMGMVFQDFALFPHLSVAGNIEFGLKKWSAKARNARLYDMLVLTGLSGLSKQFPHELSGGQQQRVALARALAPQPNILLMDEPFSNLDGELRRRLSHEVRVMLKMLNTSAILVTHDQQEAFTMADQLGVVKEGRMLQWGTPQNLYRQPNCPSVATFIGEGQLIQGLYTEAGCAITALGPIQVSSHFSFERNEPLLILLRPTDFVLDKHGSEGRLLKTQYIGLGYQLETELVSGEYVRCYSQDSYRSKIGQPLHLRIKPGYYRAFKRSEKY